MERSAGRRYDEDSEQPVDYSKKYTERKPAAQNRPIDDPPRTERKKEFAERDTKVDLFGDYAETDLDQPTDYSLRYAEDDTDDDEKQNTEYFPGSVQEDTIKTYCTEGTPYETPLNFSTATSMSDLRLEDAKDSVDLPKKSTKKTSDLCGKESQAPKNSRASDAPLQSKKMIDFYPPGESDGFSCANSLNSVGSPTPQQSNATPTVSKKAEGESERAAPSSAGLRSPEEADGPIEGKSNPRVVDKEGKIVTFSQQDYYAEQTPLMFSRCSSLGSLSGFEQHSIHDDRSSIVSDFSRRTSGIVSPSELPDSPTQTIPPSPRSNKSQCSDFGSKSQAEAVRPSVRHLSYAKPNLTRNSVFEDDIATFKEESTPIEFSTATSLSSLTIDDEIKITDTSKTQSDLEGASSDLEKDVKPTNTPAEKASAGEIEKDQEQVSDGDEDDEDMLAACISMGMQNNRYRQSFKTVQKPVQPEAGNLLPHYQRNLNRLEPRVAVEPAPKAGKSAIEVVAAPDTVHVYCTEDTPADISPVGSQSNLSALSMPSVPEDVERIEESKSPSEVGCHRNDLSDESSNLSGEDEKILDECIQSGMPKVRQITPPPATRFAQKAEGLTQKFNICGTPSSSPVESGHGNKNSKPLRGTLENELSDDSPNHSDDEAILTECIRSAMPKVRLNISTLIAPPASQPEKLKASVARKPSSFQSSYADQPKHRSKKSAPFEDNLSLSEEDEDIILAQCIRSGMPKALNASSSSLPPTKKQSDQYAKARVRGSVHPSKSCSRSAPGRQASHKVDSDVPGASFHRFPIKSDARASASNGGFERASCARSFPNSENVENISRSQAPSCRSPMSNGTDNDDEELCRNAKSNVAPSRHSSVSSLSEEGSLGSIEEWALLELCISSGMPRNKYRLKGMKNGEAANSHENREAIGEDNYSICSYNSYVCKT